MASSGHTVHILPLSIVTLTEGVGPVHPSESAAPSQGRLPSQALRGMEGMTRLDQV